MPINVTIVVPYTAAELRQAADTLKILLGNPELSAVLTDEAPAKAAKPAKERAKEPAKEPTPVVTAPEPEKAASAPAEAVPAPLHEIITKCARIDRQGTVAVLQSFGGRKLSEVPESSHDELRAALMAQFGDKL